MFIRLNRFLVGLIFTVIIVQLGCHSFFYSDVSKKTKKKYGITQVPFNGKWWHYYERGLSFEEGGLWKEAEADFRTAISKRNNDSNSARTYGRHWISINNKPGYFPQRELGIVLYRQDFIEQAIDMFEASIKTQASTRAKIYLNRARKKFIKKNQSDVSNPYIEIYSPQNSSWTNDSLICIEGIVKDDTFVQSIQVDNKDIYIDQSNERIRFNIQKTLIEGKNIISIIAHDLSGKQSIKNITINVDYIGPSIHIENIQKTQSELICKGSIFDNSGIVKVTINEVEHICSNKKNFSFIKRFSLKKNVFSIDISAIDLAGNKTSANIPFFPDNNTSSKKKLLAYNGNSEINNMMIFALTNNISQNDNKSPEIILKKYNTGKNYTVFLNSVLIEGNVYDNSGVKALFINKKRIDFFGNKCAFSYLVHLKKGYNSYIIRAIDHQGNECRQILNFKYQEPSIKAYDKRLKVYIDDFEEDSSKTCLNNMTKQLLDLKMLEQRRFRCTLTKDQNFDYILNGIIIEMYSWIEIFVNLTHSETNNSVVKVDAYWENEHADKNFIVTRDILLNLIKQIIHNLSFELPLIEGIILEKEPKKITTTLNSLSRIKENMEIIVFEKHEDIDFKVLGIATINEVNDKNSIAILRQLSKLIQKGDFVITR